jgi:hypothetical protein
MRDALIGESVGKFGRAFSERQEKIERGQLE